MEESKNDIKTHKRTIRYTVRFSPEENKIILNKASAIKKKKNVGVYLRNAGLHKDIKARLTESEQNIYRQLAGMSNNVNQLTLIARLSGVLDLIETIESTLKGINDALEKLR